MSTINEKESSLSAEESRIPKDTDDLTEYILERSERGKLYVLGVQDARAMLDYVADKVISKKDYLTEIDSAIGDGDHGIGMAGGMKRVKEALREMKKTDNVYEVFEASGKAMLMSMGGASGVIFGSLFYAGTLGEAARKELEQQDFARMFRKSLETIKERGKAGPGDKTMVDALEPAVEAMEKNTYNGLVEMMRKAEEAALTGIETSKEYRAKFGRAKALGDRARGHRDAGAVSVWLILQGMREFLEG